MAEDKIDEVIEHARSALDDLDLDKARHYAQEAVALIIKEKDDFLAGINIGRTEQQLADWFGACSYVFSEVFKSLR